MRHRVGGVAQTCGRRPRRPVGIGPATGRAFRGGVRAVMPHAD
jgi:hypothetical protein